VLLLLWGWLGASQYAGVIGWDSDGKLPVSTVTYVVPGMPADRAGLRAGDKVDFSAVLYSGLSERLEWRDWYQGHSYTFAVQRGSHHFRTTVTPIAVPRNAGYWLTFVVYAWMIAFAIVLALRGSGRRATLLAWLLLLWAAGGLGGLLGPGYVSTPWPWLNEFAYLLAGPVNGAAVALLVTISSAFGRPISPQRRGLEIASYAATAVYVAIATWDEIAPALLGRSPLPNGVEEIALGTVLLLAAVCAVSALIAVRGEERQRAAWLLIPLAASYLITATFSVGSIFAGGYWQGAQVPLGVATAIAAFVLPIMLTYAVLRRRLLDVDFVLNRAAVFAGVSFVVIGAFVFAEWLLNKVFVESSRTTSTLIGLGIALALGLSLRFIHRYVDRFVDQLFFRTRHQHEQKLRSFAHEAAFITDYDTLLDDVVREVSTNAEAERVSILVRNNDGNYDTVRGTNGSAKCVSENDRAVLKMRTWHAPVDLDGVETLLDGAWAYPLMSRGDLVGILVCGAKRDGQGYAPDESEALSGVAHGVGTALGTLGRSRTDVIAEIGDLKTTLEKMHVALQTIVDEQRELRSQFGRLSNGQQFGGGPAAE
jgi:hypothetical protein